MKADIKVLEQKVKASINLDTERDDHRETKLDREIEQDLDQQSEQCYEAGDNTSLSIGGELHNRANFEQVGSAFVAQGYENGNIGLEGDKILASSNRGYARLNFDEEVGKDKTHRVSASDNPGSVLSTRRRQGAHEEPKGNKDNGKAGKTVKGAHDEIFGK